MPRSVTKREDPHKMGISTRDPGAKARRAAEETFRFACRILNVVPFIREPNSACIRDRGLGVRGIRIRAYVRILHPGTGIIIFNLLFLPTPTFLLASNMPPSCQTVWLHHGTALPSKWPTPEQVSPLFASRLAFVPFTCKTYVDGALAVRPPSRQSTRSGLRGSPLLFFLRPEIQYLLTARGPWDDQR
jgi:hypothetical protein